jgi:hypothetical protein
MARYPADLLTARQTTVSCVCSSFRAFVAVVFIFRIAHEILIFFEFICIRLFALIIHVMHLFHSVTSSSKRIFVQIVGNALAAFFSAPVLLASIARVRFERIHDACIVMVEIVVHSAQQIIQTGFSKSVPVAFHIQPSSSTSAAMHVAQHPPYFAHRSFRWSAVCPKALKIQTLTPDAGLRMLSFIIIITSIIALVFSELESKSAIVSPPVPVFHSRFIIPRAEPVRSCTASFAFDIMQPV